MTKIRETGNSSMIQDRRASGGGGGGLGGMFGGGGFPLPMKLGGGVIGIVLALAIAIIPRLLNGAGNSSITSNNAVSSASGQDSSGAAADGTCNL